MTGNGLRTQFPYEGSMLSPRPMYDFPSPSSNYPSGLQVGVPSPSFFPMAYQISPRFGSSAFIPPPDVFGDRRDTVREDGGYTPRDLRKRSSDVMNTDPVAMHLLVETAIGDSQYFDILTVEEVDSLKQEQKLPLETPGHLDAYPLQLRNEDVPLNLIESIDRHPELA